MAALTSPVAAPSGSAPSSAVRPDGTIDLDALELLLTAATPGPFRICGEHRGGCACGQIWSFRSDVQAPVATTFVGYDDDFSADQRIANARFIAAIATAAPALIAAARELGKLRPPPPPDAPDLASWLDDGGSAPETEEP